MGWHKNHLITETNDCKMCHWCREGPQIHIPGMMEMFPQEHSLQGCKSHGNAPTGGTHCSLPGMLKPSGHRMREPSPIPAAPSQLPSLGPGLCTPSMGLCQIPPQTPVTERAAHFSYLEGAGKHSPVAVHSSGSSTGNL